MTLNIDESLNAKGFTKGADAPGRTIEHIDIHHWGNFGQTHDGVNAFFCTTGPGQTSAHFVASAGRVNCIVSPSDVAWHAGDWAENMRSIGIECRPEASDEDYATVAELIKWLRDQYGDLPLHPHKEFYNTACPGIWDLGRLDALARGTQVAPAPVVPQSAPVQVPSDTWMTTPGPGQCRVDPGDTLSAIAAQFGVDLNALIALNGITEPDKIFPGMLLDLPQAPAPAPAPSGLPPYCTVDPGDTLGGIADQYGVPLQYILDRNPGINPDLIFPGQRINL